MNNIICGTCGDEIQYGHCRACIDALVEERVREALAARKNR